MLSCKAARDQVHMVAMLKNLAELAWFESKAAFSANEVKAEELELYILCELMH